MKLARSLKSAVSDGLAAMGYIPTVDDARAALERAQADLRDLFDANASEAKVVAGEEAVREARRVLTRAENAAASVQRKLTAAEQAEADRQRADLIARVKTSLQARADGAAAIEAGSKLIAEGKARIDASEAVIREAVTAKLFTPDATAALRDLQALIRFSLIAAGAMQGPYSDDPQTTARIIEKDNQWLQTYLEVTP